MNAQKWSRLIHAITACNENFVVCSPEICLNDSSFHVTASRNKNNIDLRITKYGIKVCSVSFVFKLISYDANVEPMMVAVNNKQFNANVSTSIAHTLATWQQLIDPVKKFIQNDSSKCCAVFLECPICFVKIVDSYLFAHRIN